MRKVPIDFGDLQLAFANSSHEVEFYLDTQTGHVLIVTGESTAELDKL